MAKWLDKFMGSMNLYEDNEDDDDLMEDGEDVELEDEDIIPEKNSRAYKRMMSSGKYDYSEPEEEVFEEEEEEEEEKPAQKGIFGFGKSSAKAQSAAPRTVRTQKASMEVSMIRPTTMDDARDICDMLLSGRAVVINMEGVQVDLAQRIIDFSSGACYSIEGNLQKISNYIFIITPNNIELSGEFQNSMGIVE